MTDLSTLAARVEGAGEGSRELDAEIDWTIAGIRGIKPQPNHYGDVAGFWRETANGPLRESPRYTGSIDAAMTLAADLGGQVTFFRDGTAKAFLWQPYPLAVEVRAATPALALTAAALKARA